MAFFRELRSMLKTPAGAMLGSVFLLMAVAYSFAFFIDWSGPADDLSAKERAHAEDCIAAHRELGDDALRVRPECKDVLDTLRQAAAAKTAAP